MGAMEYVQKGLYKNETELNQAYADLGDYLGMSIENAQDFLIAQDLMAGAVSTTGSYLGWMAEQMFNVGAIQINPDGSI